ncbi:MAG: DUF368 domain-containing protein [Candidatus Thermoplasmatota archaeon]
MGLANITPGVSGGTMALLMGIYERLIHAVNTIPLRSSLSVFREGKEKFIEDMKAVDYEFLSPLIIGIALATLVLARLIGTFLENYQAMTFSFFFGLILASGGTIYHKIDSFKPTLLISGIVGFLFSFYIASLSPFEANHTLPVIFISGAVAIPTMILPGISGSFILILLQQYKYMIDALNSLDILVIVVFMLGAVIGLFSFAKLVEVLFKKRRTDTLVFLFGLILGGLRAPVVRAFEANPTFPEWLIPAVLGALVVSVLDSIYRINSK